VATSIPFVSPTTGSLLQRDGEALASGDERFPIRGGIPRFLEGSTYVDSFGEQWNRYRRVQLDSNTAKPLTSERFLAGTGWSRAELEGRSVLEAGCGAGRFTEVLLAAGASVWSVDASSAVDVALANNSSDRLTIAQADLFRLPFAEASFERVFCYGVLQHTPDPRAGFLKLVRYAAPGGLIAMDVYRKLPYIDRWSAKLLWRPLTTRLPRNLLRRVIEWYMPRWLPIDTRLARVPKIGRFLVAVVPCWNYTGLLDLDQDEFVAWAVLDTFDALSPTYDNPQTVESVQEWCATAGLVDVDVRYGGNGVLINARVPD
jgi:SAM-dependent methyltransferase